MNMADRVFAIAGDWALASDGIQWMLMRYKTRKSGPYWQPVSFVRSEREILARCMREKGVGAEMARLLLSGLPETFDEWKTSQDASNTV
jgi:hypothetical protein